MPSDTALVYRPGSPFNAEENISKRDKNYRKYASAVERALSLFDTALQEWADYISFLGRLSKALQTRPAEIREVPHSRLVAKRLAQCLSPLLPAGVHQKALDIYAVIFSALGSEGLSVDLPQYLSGLAPLLSFASLTVKPSLLSLFETYIIKIDPRAWRPALKAIILSLLPGLEDPASEEFEQTHALLNQFREALKGQILSSEYSRGQQDDRFFWQSLFVATVSSASRRPGALAYLERHLPSMGSKSLPEDRDSRTSSTEGAGSVHELTPVVEALLSPEPGLLVRCFAAGLQDEQLLIQRGFLELLVTRLPLHSAVLRERVTSQDRELLVIAATSVVVRREMSLNRRLWIWFLGQSASSQAEQSGQASPQSENADKRRAKDVFSPMQYFEQYGFDALVEGLVRQFRSHNTKAAARARPFRICLSLMDRWEIGGLVLAKVFKPAMDSVHRYKAHAPSNEPFSEVLKSASGFFDAVQSNLIWKEMSTLILSAFGDDSQGSSTVDASNTVTQLELVYFIITAFNIREEEMLAIHIPLVLLLLLHYAGEIADSPGFTKLYVSDPNVPSILLKCALYLLEQLPEQPSTQDDTALANESIESDLMKGLPAFVRGFYENAASHHTSTSQIMKAIRTGLQRSSSNLILACLKDDILAKQTDTALSIAARISNLYPKLNCFDHQAIFSHLALAADRAKSKVEPEFGLYMGQVSTFEFAHSIIPSAQWRSDPIVQHLLRRLVDVLWFFISPSNPRHNVEAVRGIWRLHRLSSDTDMVEAAVTALMHGTDCTNKIRGPRLGALQRFTCFWTHTVTMFRSLPNRRSPVHVDANSSGGKSERLTEDTETIAKPLLLTLDALREADTSAFPLISGWLQIAPDIHLLIDLLIKRIYACALFKSVHNPNYKNESGNISDLDSRAHMNRLAYYLSTVTNVLSVVRSRSLDILNAQSEYLMLNNGVDQQKLAGEEVGTENSARTIQHHLLDICSFVLAAKDEKDSASDILGDIKLDCVKLLRQVIPNLLYHDDAATTLSQLLIDALLRSVNTGDSALQIALVDALKSYLNQGKTPRVANPSVEARNPPGDLSKTQYNDQRSSQDAGKSAVTEDVTITNPALLTCIIGGFEHIEDSNVLEHWVDFLETVLPLYTVNIFQIMLPLADCVNTSIKVIFEKLCEYFARQSTDGANGSDPIQSLNLLLNALELILAKGHDQISREEARKLSLPEPSQGYFGNMVTGLFAAEVQTSRPTTANDRLSVLLCFRDAVRISYRIWAWGSETEETQHMDPSCSGSFNYSSVRLRNRSRRILENLFGVEILECLEVIAELWANSKSKTSRVADLLQTLESTRPKHTMPSMFNALYSRTNPAVLDAFRQSTLTSDISEVQLAQFLLAYTHAMDDDALDEVWTDCVAFTRDVLTNPMPHRQILPYLLEFVAVLGAKIENTNFGEARRMRREIGELYVRLLSALFTIKPLSFTLELTDPSDAVETKGVGKAIEHETTLAIVSKTVPQMLKVLLDIDRIAIASTTISSQILNPTFHWKHFPLNVTFETVQILQTLSRVTEISKIWKKDVAEAFNEPRFFAAQPLQLVKMGWLPILRQWTLSDGDRLSEILSRLSFSTAAGMMFGVGASSAKLEADRKAQLNLRRIALLIISADRDKFVSNLRLIEEKLGELLKTTASSSPSSTIRADVYMVYRALILKNGPEHLASFFPVINSELYSALSSIGQIASRETYNIVSILHAAKLLDTLLLLGPDDFQLRGWLYITDTVDAVYRPPKWTPVALVDELVEVLDNESSAVHSAPGHFTNDLTKKGALPLLRWDDTNGIPREKLLDQVLRPFLRHLSINAFESMYQMESADREACSDELLKDLFDDSTLV